MSKNKNTWNNKNTWKNTVHGMITITDGDHDDAEVLGTYYITERFLGEALDEVVGLDLFDGVIEKSDKRMKMPDGKETTPHLFIDEKQVPTYIKKTRGVACCAYNATNEFMKHWLGRQFDRHDNNWYKLNSLVTEHGLPQANSFTVIQQLTEPYGVGISRIIVPKNSRRFKEHQPFMLALGANPFFMADGRTTNEEAYAKLFPEPVLEKMNLDELGRRKHKQEQFNKWRFECGDQPFRGAIIMRQFQHSSTGHNGGSNYIGVRDTTDVENWWMAIKLDELSKIDYQRPLDIPEYKEWEGAVTYRWRGITDATGRTLGQIESSLRTNSYKYNQRNPAFGQTTALVSASNYPPPPPKGNVHELWHNENNNSRAVNNSSSKSETDFDEKIWAYPPVCSECKMSPGDNVYVNDKRACRHCGTEIKAEHVEIQSLLDGWEPVGMDDLDRYFDLDDLPDEPTVNSGGELPEYDPYFWGKEI